MEEVSWSEAARRIGISRVQLARLRDRGVLADFVVTGDGSRSRLRWDGLEQRVRESCRRRIDSPWQSAPAPAAAAEPVITPPWTAIAGWANSLMDPAFPSPPWSPEQWQAVMGVYQQASDMAADHGQINGEIWAAFCHDDDAVWEAYLARRDDDA